MLTARYIDSPAKFRVLGQHSEAILINSFSMAPAMHNCSQHQSRKFTYLKNIC